MDVSSVNFFGSDKKGTFPPQKKNQNNTQTNKNLSERNVTLDIDMELSHSAARTVSVANQIN